MASLLPHRLAAANRQNWKPWGWTHTPSRRSILFFAFIISSLLLPFFLRFSLSWRTARSEAAIFLIRWRPKRVRDKRETSRLPPAAARAPNWYCGTLGNRALFMSSQPGTARQHTGLDARRKGNKKRKPTRRQG